jgi:uncharacterized membrane protein
MTTTRLEAFSDGVIAVIITIMVLEIKVPEGADWPAFRAVIPSMAHYLLSFVMVGIYWNNHHHMLHATKKISGGVLWANLHLLFWLSLIPFGTSWTARTGAEVLPTACYGVILFIAGIAYLILARTIVALEGEESELGKAIGKDVKSLLSASLYLLAIGLAFVRPWLADAIYVCVALMWLIPDRRIEKRHAEVAS